MSWLEGVPTTQQYARDLVLWAVRTKRAANISIPARLKNAPSQALDEDERKEIAHRLLRDDRLDARDRVGGLLNLLYAQPFSVIIRPTVDQVVVREERVFLRLGKEPLEMTARSGRSTLLGSSPGSVRASISAIRDLTAEVPAAVVNRLLGISTSSATSWARRSSRASCAAEVARRSDPYN